MRLANEGVAFATRPRARSIVKRLAGEGDADRIELDLNGVEAASPGFLDELFARLAENYTTVTISGAQPALHPLIDRVIARRGLESRFKVTAEA